MRDKITIKEFEELLQDPYNKDAKCFVRWAKNGRKYIWEIKNLTKKQCVDLINKYGIEQICDDTIWLNY